MRIIFSQTYSPPPPCCIVNTMLRPKEEGPSFIPLWVAESESGAHSHLQIKPLWSTTMAGPRFRVCDVSTGNIWIGIFSYPFSLSLCVLLFLTLSSHLISLPSFSSSSSSSAAAAIIINVNWTRSFSRSYSPPVTLRRGGLVEILLL